MTHPLSDNYDREHDAELLRLMRFQAQSINQPDPKVARLFRQAANRLEDLISKADGADGIIRVASNGKPDTCTQKLSPES